MHVQGSPDLAQEFAAHAKRSAGLQLCAKKNFEEVIKYATDYEPSSDAQIKFV